VPKTTLRTNLAAGVDVGHVSDSDILALLWNTHAVNVMDPAFAGGAVGDDNHDDLPCFDAAYDALPAVRGGLMYCPSPVSKYRFKNTGTFVIDDKPVCLMGEDGLSQPFRPDDAIHSAVILHSTVGAPIVNITDNLGKAGANGIHSWNSMLLNIAVQGSRAAGAAQVGVIVDNRCSHLHNVMIGDCGGRGLQVVDCVEGSVINVVVHNNAGDGILADPTMGTGTFCAVTATLFQNVTSSSNDGHNWVLRGGVFGLKFESCDGEGNAGQPAGYNWFFDQVGDSNHGVKCCRGSGNWSEGRLGIRVNATGVYRNRIDFVHIDQPISYAVGATRGNQFPYNDWSVNFRMSDQVGIARTDGGYNSSDIDARVLRNMSDTADGIYRAASYVSTFALALGQEDVVNTSVTPRLVSTGNAFCAPNGRGLQGRNQAGTADIQIAWVGTDNRVYLGDGATADALVLNGPKMAFYSGAPVVKPAVAGSRGGATAAVLASLITALASGATGVKLLTDNTTA
jgi:hypothetical protein